jgi:hypothetical protein
MREGTTAEGGSPVFRLIYRSCNRIPAARLPAELGRLFTAARSNNKQAGLCGALLLSGPWFVQTLEGDEPSVRALFDRIMRDPRHDAVSLLQADPVQERAFPRWSMARVSDDGSAPDTYLIAHETGIAPAASRGTTALQEDVLDAMRRAVRGEAVVG